LVAVEPRSALPFDPPGAACAMLNWRILTQLAVRHGKLMSLVVSGIHQMPVTMVKRFMHAAGYWPGTHSMQLVDLRQLTSSQLEPLLAEEAQQWREELYWDYRPSIELIKKFVDARSLTGSAILENGRPVGYAFYVLEDRKGLVGGLFVSPRHAQQELSQRLLTDTLTTLSGIPKLERVEAQLIPFGYALDPVLSEYGFRLYMRQFMIAPLLPPVAAEPFDVVPGLVREGPGSGLILERWDHRYFEPSARLIQLAYANHVDGEINDQYRSESGALRFLKNIIILPGCGQFQPEASFVLREPHASHLAGVILNSRVSTGVGHTTQICAMPGYQGRGLGRRLMEASMQALRARRYTKLSLTVTSGNERAVRLYEKLGFAAIKKFAAGVWTAY
jgi:ribosomal protein S18 acetylase RimI-like enzyme